MLINYQIYYFQNFILLNILQKNEINHFHFIIIILLINFPLIHYMFYNFLIHNMFLLVIYMILLLYFHFHFNFKLFLLINLNILHINLIKTLSLK